MIGALFYLQAHSIVNRTLVRLKRLRQPKYLLGAIVGGLYFYFYFFRWMFAGARRPTGFSGVAGEDLVLYEAIGAGALLVIMLLAWIIPHGRAALVFTEAEVAFLFPAPISRRGLIHFKLLRSQLAILFTTLLLTVITNRFGGHAWTRAAGWWLVLSTLNLHFLGSSFARTFLLDRGISNWQRRLVVLLLVVGAAVVTIVWARRTLPRFDPERVGDLAAMKAYAHQVLVAGPIPYLLYPFRLLVRPYLAQSGIGFLTALWQAVLLFLLHYVWVVSSNVAFEEASVEASRRLADRLTALRSGQGRGRAKGPKAKRAPFSLGATGMPAIAFLWKNLIGAGQAFTLRLWLVIAAIAGGVCIGLRNTAGSTAWMPAFGMVGVLLLWSLLIGPQFLRQDFRHDLARADMLKVYPVKGWQIALGELLAPAVILTGVQWFLLLLSLIFFVEGEFASKFGVARSLAVAGGAALVFPMLDLITLQIPNAAVLLFPAWFQSSKDGAHGIEATGQRLIFILAQVVVFAVALIPAAVVFVIVFFVGKMALPVAVVVGLASVCTAVVLAVEAAFGMVLLGRLFERLDLSMEG
jgi:hypothetical protein